MGLFEDTQNQYYQNESNFGNYQFTSLENVINQFMVVYVGEGKVIPKARRIDVAFHAQRALAELSFDTFKSFKSQQIDVPPTLQMILPHDYVNYTKLSWSDASGIKHPLYPTKDTNNPYQIQQNDDGSYFFGDEGNVILNPSFTSEYNYPIHWLRSSPGPSKSWDSTRVTGSGQYFFNYVNDLLYVDGTQGDGRLAFGHLWNNSFGTVNGEMSRAYGAWQIIDVTFAQEIQLLASASSGARQTNDSGTVVCDYGVVRIGITSTNPDVGFSNGGSTLSAKNSNPGTGGANPSPNRNANNFDLGYLEWNDGTSSEKEIESINVSNYETVWIYIQSFSPWNNNAITTSAQSQGGTTAITPTTAEFVTHQFNFVNQVSVIVPGQNPNLSTSNIDGNSSTWVNYKSVTPSENNNEDYEDDVYWPLDGRRYGLDPSNAQVNGSFYIDQLRGKINFSSNISGKTVILDYISDSLGTDGEMQVHKFAEEAMYKCIAHAIISASSYGQVLVPRFTKEKFAAIRKAKLRLSNIKLEELTQILRGKSKQIKH